MKILWENYLEDSTVTSTSEDSLYPVENLYHRFLEKKYMSVGSTGRIIVEFPEDRTVSMIAYGFTNVRTSSGDGYKIVQGASDTLKIVDGSSEILSISLQSRFELQDNAGNVLYSSLLNVGGDINVNYVPPTVCRRVVIDVSASEEVYIGGLAIGDPLYLKYIGNRPDLVQGIRSAYTKTVGGQVIGRNVRSLKSWNITLPIITNDKRQEMEEMFYEKGNINTFFASLYDENEGLEKPIFCHFTSGGSFSRITHNNKFSTSFTISEAR